MNGIIYLDPTGKRLKSEAVNDLKSALDNLQQCIDALQEEQGIGTEFGIEKIGEVYSNIDRCRANLAAL